MKSGGRKQEKLHPRNRHRGGLDFERLTATSPNLEQFVAVNEWGSESIDFANPSAVKALNTALLKQFYGVAPWDIPPGCLCPSIPGRADYLHYLADLLASSNREIIPRGAAVRALDIGVGANCVYPSIGSSGYGWRFLGSDIDPIAIFHASAGEAEEGTRRKWKNLGKESSPQQRPTLNFGGQGAEPWCPGGEPVRAQACRGECARSRALLHHRDDSRSESESDRRLDVSRQERAGEVGVNSLGSGEPSGPERSARSPVIVGGPADVILGARKPRVAVRSIKGDL